MQVKEFSAACRNAAIVITTAIFLSACLESEDKATSDQGLVPPPSNTAPTISGNPPASVLMGEMYSFTPNANDADNDPLTFTVQNRPNWASFDTGTGTLSGQPTLGDVGLFSNVRISVSDGVATTSLPAFSINVLNSASGNRPPTISGVPATVAEVAVAYSFTPSASDPDGDVLNFGIAGQPGWASFNSQTGELSGTPAAGDAGNYAGIVIDVTDGEFTSNLPAFTITVTAPETPPSNSPPTIAGNPPVTVEEGAAYSFTPTASDPDGDTLTFDITGQPVWASFNPQTGELSGTPAAGDAGNYAGIVIEVTDGEFTVGLPAFAITVTAPDTNTPPTISGTPAAEVTANSVYSFTPTAEDADGDSLSFSIDGLPGWASFDSQTGELSGTPADADVAVYGDIRIAVTDGTDSAELGPFSITVVAVSLGSVTLNWTAPTENEDGTPLTDLAGYRIYWGTTPGSYPDSVTLDNPGLTTHVVENLAPGTYEFVATSFNTAGVESSYSNPATKTVQP